VGKRDADLILASGFSCPIEELGFTEKLRRFEVLIERRRRLKVNTLHISLNFSPDEKLSPQTMGAIAVDYIKRMGFGEQPFLVYEHKDAKHPHIHIVTTNIKSDGSFIDLNYIGKRLSEPARKAIEIDFGLIQAETRKKEVPKIIAALDLLPAMYGKEETKHVITNVLSEVLGSYKFSTLQELNLILRDMNVVADRGAPGSRMHQAGGLVFSLLTKDGYRTGIPIKASSIYGKPTLKVLHRKFAAGKVKKLAVQKFTDQMVSAALARSRTFDEFALNLKKRRISIHLQQDLLGIISDVSFVDHRNRVVFNGKALGIDLNKIYALRAAGYLKPSAAINRKPENKGRGGSFHTFPAGQPSIQLIQSLLQPGGGMGGPDEYPKRKKKKKKGPSL
jgi:hypothetical protein